MITGLPTFEDDEIPTYTKLNLLASTLVAKFANGITGADLKYPFKLEGDLDLNGHTIVNIGVSAGGIRFADDFTSIQAAIDDLPTTGGVVLLSNSSYSITSPISLQGSDGQYRQAVMLLGAGPASTLTQAGASPVVKLGYTRNAIQNVAIDMASGTGTGISIEGTDCRVSNVRVYGGAATSKCIDLATSARTRVNNCLLESGYGIFYGTFAGAGPFYINNNKIVASYGIYLNEAESAYIVDNIITASTGNSINLTIRPATTESGTVVARNILSAPTAGVNIYLDTQGAPFLQIVGNICADAGVGVDLVSVLQSPGVGTFGIMISGNTFISLQTRGIRVTGGSGAVRGLSIVNNSFTDCTNAGAGNYHIELNGADTTNLVKGVLIGANNFQKASPVPSAFIRIGANCDYILAADNVGDQAAGFSNGSTLNVNEYGNLWVA